MAGRTAENLLGPGDPLPFGLFNAEGGSPSGEPPSVVAGPARSRGPPTGGQAFWVAASWAACCWACARASTSVSLLAPATTVAACSRPGCREIRSIGPEIDTAGLRPGILPLSRLEDDVLEAEVLWVDRFGNAQLNLDPTEIEAAAFRALRLVSDGSAGCSRVLGEGFTP